ncbi:MAG: hypothetical protein IPK93_05105 [Solirubrobacterales bacterium]|nr:hypothetical protein [Solirubrobacterales bacterium]
MAANEMLVAEGIETIAATTLHGMRRTYASLRIAAGDDPVYVAQQLGHVSAHFTMSVYAKSTKRRNRLMGNTQIAFDDAINWAAVSQIYG